MTTFSPLLGLWEGVPGDPAIKNAWGPFLNTNDNLIEQAITGDNGYAGGAGGISIAGLTTYTLTATAGSANQARQLLYPFVGALTGNCTVTIAASVKIGWAANFTTGGHSVILTSGMGSTLTLPPNGVWYFFYSDGAGDVSTPSVGFGNFSPSSTLTVAGLDVTGLLNAGTIETAGSLAVSGGAAITGGLVADTLTVSGAAVFEGTGTYGAGDLIVGGYTVAAPPSGLLAGAGITINSGSIDITPYATDNTVFGSGSFAPTITIGPDGIITSIGSVAITASSIGAGFTIHTNTTLTPSQIGPIIKITGSTTPAVTLPAATATTGIARILQVGNGGCNIDAIGQSTIYGPFGGATPLALPGAGSGAYVEIASDGTVWYALNAFLNGGSIGGGGGGGGGPG